jgi:ribosomal protein L31E
MTDTTPVSLILASHLDDALIELRSGETAKAEARIRFCRRLVHLKFNANVRVSDEILNIVWKSANPDMSADEL